MTDELTIAVGGQTLGGWKDVDITRRAEGFPPEFAIGLSAPAGAAGKVAIAGAFCSVRIGGDLVITGVIDRDVQSGSGDQHRFDLVGRGLTADLVDCSGEWPSGQRTDVDALAIATTLAKPYKVAVRLGPGAAAGPSVPQWLLNLGETGAEIIQRTARNAGLLAYEDTDGALVLARIGTERAASGVVYGQNVQSNGVSTTSLTGGADIETDAELRSRMLVAYAAPAQGGSITDYGNWALAVPGVTRAWIKPAAMGPGTLAVLFMMDDAAHAHGGFPQGTNGVSAFESRDTAATGDQLAVANHLFGLQSVTALVYAVAPIANSLTLTIAGLAAASGTLKAAIAAAVAAALLADAVPGGITNVSSIEAAIAAVPGTGGFVLSEIDCSAGAVAPGAAGNITSNAGALPVLAGIIWA